MGNFDRGGDRGGNRGGFNKGGFGGKPSFQKKSFGNDSDRPRETFKATCSECSKQCEVPFRPTNGKPVFCDNCFGAQRDSNDSRGGRDSYNDRAPRREFNNDRPAFRPQLDRPAFTPANTGSSDETKKALAEISTKLDRLVTAIEKMTGSTSNVGQSAPKTETFTVAKAKAKAGKEKVEVKKTETPVAPKTEAKKVEAKKAPAKKAVVKKAAPAKKVVAKKKK